MMAASSACGLFSVMAALVGAVDDRSDLVEWFAARAQPISATETIP